MADYFDDVNEVIFNRNLRIDMNTNHIIDDNLKLRR